MNRFKLLSIAAALLLVAAPMAVAQPGDGYGDFPQEVQTTNSPAGLAIEPGSQLLYLLDTGIRPSEIDPDFDPGASIPENFGLNAPLWTNFIAITNTNPTDAVTLHFRYFNENCQDVVDFLVLLTCNDTMLVNPFDYTIPGTSVNVSEFFFGPALSTAEFGEGRFLLFVTASGDAGNDSGEGNDTSPSGDRGDFDDPEDLDEFADWLYPFELTPDDLVDDCPGIDVDKIGVRAGVNNDNLSIFNASAISFNYLVGFHTVGVARAGGQASFKVNAWTRPAVNAGKVLDCEDADLFAAGCPDSVTYNPTTPQDVDGDGDFDAFDADAVNDGGMDGDGPLAPKGVILSGSEHIWLTLLRSQQIFLPTNTFYLRQDAHGGNTVETNCEGFTPNQPRCDADNPFLPVPVAGGSMAWTLFPTDAVPPEDQFLSMASLKDDYNGSLNPDRSPFAVFSDNAYRMDAAATYYNLVIFNNNEVPLRIEEEIEPISPPPPIDPVVIRVAVRCLDAFRFDVFNVSGVRIPDGGVTDFVFTENFQTFSVEDLFSLDGRGLAAAFLAAPVPVNDELGPGWIRFDRILTRDFWYDATGGSILPFAVDYDGERGTYVTIAQNIIFVDAFGASDWVPLSASDAGANAQ